MERITAHPEAVVIHDTTEFRFTTERADLGYLRKKGELAKSGFLMHCALAVSADEHREPLGIVGAWPWMRGCNASARHRKAGMQFDRLKETEQARWARGVQQVHADAPEPSKLIHVMDSEADDYALLSVLVQQSSRFVIRGCYDRRVDTELPSSPTGKMRAFIESAQAVGSRTVSVSPRRATTGMKDRRRQLPRGGREAELCFSAAPVVLRRPDSAFISLPETLAVHLVRVWEKHPPDGVEPLEWLLLTTEPIQSVEQIVRVVDLYRIRWVIEEFFKAIKSGCAFEKRQLESFRTLAVALAIFMPIAWSLLRLRSTARSQADAPATIALSPVQLEVLRRATGTHLPASPTIRDALLAIAYLGGHLKRNGEPGWQTLGRGYEDLLMLERGFRLAMPPSELIQAEDAPE
jgi:hypothetical protein